MKILNMIKIYINKPINKMKTNHQQSLLAHIRCIRLTTIIRFHNADMCE